MRVYSSLMSQASSAAVVGQRQRHRQRAVAGEDADLDRAPRADQLDQQGEELPPVPGPICMPAAAGCARGRSRAGLARRVRRRGRRAARRRGRCCGGPWSASPLRASRVGPAQAGQLGITVLGRSAPWPRAPGRDTVRAGSLFRPAGPTRPGASGAPRLAVAQADHVPGDPRPRRRRGRASAAPCSRPSPLSTRVAIESRRRRAEEALVPGTPSSTGGGRPRAPSITPSTARRCAAICASVLTPPLSDEGQRREVALQPVRRSRSAAAAARGSPSG